MQEFLRTTVKNCTDISQSTLTIIVKFAEILGVFSAFPAVDILRLVPPCFVTAGKIPAVDIFFLHGKNLV